jgi:UV DNA damage repair endonuclease
MYTTSLHHTNAELTSSTAMPIRFGLCCLFAKEHISFRTTTAKSLLTLPRDQQLFKLSDICLHNSRNLLRAIETCHRRGKGQLFGFLLHSSRA